MSAAQIADAERRDLADLFLRLGPDEPDAVRGLVDARPASPTSSSASAGSTQRPAS